MLSCNTEGILLAVAAANTGPQIYPPVPMTTSGLNSFIYFQKITNTPITISEEEEEIDMCQAVDEMIEDGRNICRREGKSG